MGRYRAREITGPPSPSHLQTFAGSLLHFFLYGKSRRRNASLKTIAGRNCRSFIQFATQLFFVIGALNVQNGDERSQVNTTI